jgi:hypothetical protein
VNGPLREWNVYPFQFHTFQDSLAEFVLDQSVIVELADVTVD